MAYHDWEDAELGDDEAWDGEAEASTDVIDPELDILGEGEPSLTAELPNGSGMLILTGPGAGTATALPPPRT